MEGEGKSLGRLIHNLESDPDIQVAMKTKNAPENAREIGLRKLRERVARLNNLLKIDNTPHVIISNEIVLVLRAASLYCPKFMGEALMQDMHDSVCLASGYCIECGALISDRKLDDTYCVECKQKFEAREKALDEQQPGQ